MSPDRPCQVNPPIRRPICVARCRRARFHDDLDARVVFVTERAIHRRRIFQTDPVRDDERRVDLAAFDALEQDAACTCACASDPS